MAPLRGVGRIYRILLFAYPRSFRRAVGDDMAEAFADRYAAVRRESGLFGITRLWARTLRDVAVNAVSVRLDTRRERLPQARKMSSVFDTAGRETRSAVRALARRPGYTIVVALTLALGIGANSAIFSVVNSVLIRPLPFDRPDGLVMIWHRWDRWTRQPGSLALIADYRTLSRTLEPPAAWVSFTANLTGDVEPERVNVAAVTANYFPLFGLGAVIGRTFDQAEDAPGRGPTVVFSHEFWSRRFGADSSLVGQTVRLNGQAARVLGVMAADAALPQSLRSGMPVHIWTPLGVDFTQVDRTNRGYNNFFIGTRLRPGATVVQADAEVKRLIRSFEDEGLYSEAARWDAYVVSVEDDIVGDLRPALFVLMGAVGILLLIACANVANLTLVRGEARRHELAMRVALGASGGQLVRQLLIENLLLAGAGGVVGAAGGIVGVRFLVTWNPARLPRLAEVTVDHRVLLFTLAAIVLTGVAVGLLPALRAARPDLTATLRDVGRATVGRTGTRGRAALVAGQLALAAVLVIGAGLLARSFAALRSVDPGFVPHGVLTARVELPSTDYGNGVAVTDFYDRLRENLQSQPGVEAVGAASALPLQTPIGDWGLDIEGRDELRGGNPGYLQVATAGYFEALGVRLARGRFFAGFDRLDTPPVAVINETMARSYWPDEDAVGKRIRLKAFPDRPWITVVGVVRDVKHDGIAADVSEKFYLAHTQLPIWDMTRRAMTLVVRTRGQPQAALPLVRRELGALDASLPLSEVLTLDEVLAASIGNERFTALLISVFAGLALALAAVGVYGVVAYSVSLRTREIGLRLALGASGRRVMAAVLGRGFGLAAVGIAAGVVVALGISRMMAQLLYGVAATDPLVFIAVPVVLFAVAAIAGALPVRRATRVDPVAALRSE